MPVPHIFEGEVGFLKRPFLDDNFAFLSAYASIIGGGGIPNNSSTAARLANTSALASVAAANGGQVFIPAGTWYFQSNTPMPGNLHLRGAGQGATILVADGDFFSFTSVVGFDSPSWEDFTIRNDVVNGRLFVDSSGVDVNKIYWNRVTFGACLKHIVKTGGGVGVAWTRNNCQFIGATQISIDVPGMWASSEWSCYSWFNQAGMQFSGTASGSSTNSSYGSVYEQLNDYALKLNANGGDILGFLCSGTHFEANGKTTNAADVILQTATANINRGFKCVNAGWFAPSAGQTTRLQVVTGGGGNHANHSIGGGYVNGGIPILLGGSTAVRIDQDVSFQAIGLPAGTLTSLIPNTTTSTVIGAAGGAAALPATPLGYFQVTLAAGTAVKIPYYNP